MKLTTEHINQLYKFTRAHFVEWYDLQTELVDHLANDIEHIWEKEPNLSFDQAKNKAFKKFGIFGFQDVITDKSKAVNKRYWKAFWNIFKDYFKLPKILQLFLVTLIIFIIADLTEYKTTVFIIAFWVIFIVPIVFFFKYRLEVKKRFKKTGKKWMVEEMIKQSGLIFVIGFQIPLHLLTLSKNIQSFSLNIIELLIASFSLSVFATFTYVLTKIIPPKMEEEMSKQFPEYKLYKKA